MNKPMVLIMENPIYLAVQTLIKKQKKQRPFLIGINGVDLSGKSTFTINLARWLKKQGYPIQVIHLDDFHNVSSKRRQGENPITAYWYNAFNLEILEHELLFPIVEHGEVDTKLVLLDLETDSFTNHQTYHVIPNSVVLLEGVLLFRKPIDPYLSARIFLDVSFKEVLHRARIRDVPRFGEGILQSYQTKYIPVQKKYLAEYKPMDKADLIIDNNDLQNPRLFGSNL